MITHIMRKLNIELLWISKWYEYVLNRWSYKNGYLKKKEPATSNTTENA